MDRTATVLAQYLVGRLQEASETARLLVGISGIPASGKSTLAELVVRRCNDGLGASSAYTASTQGPQAVLVGLDGWHLTRAQLDALPDPKLAHDRRGAHWTFDGAAYADFVAQLRIPVRSPAEGGSHPVIKAPSFDHAVKDPEPGAVSILPHHRIIVIEGLYTFLSIDPWKAAGEMLDERWFIDVEIEEASRRLVKRHVITGVAKDWDEARWRAEENDMPNGRFIIDNMIEPTRRIPSLEDPSFVLSVERTEE